MRSLGQFFIVLERVARKVCVRTGLPIHKQPCRNSRPAPSLEPVLSLVCYSSRDVYNLHSAFSRILSAPLKSTPPFFYEGEHVATLARETVAATLGVHIKGRVFFVEWRKRGGACLRASILRSYHHVQYGELLLYLLDGVHGHYLYTPALRFTVSF